MALHPQFRLIIEKQERTMKTINTVAAIITILASTCVDVLADSGSRPPTNGVERVEIRLQMVADGWPGANAAQRLEQFAQTNGVSAAVLRDLVIKTTEDRVSKLRRIDERTLFGLRSVAAMLTLMSQTGNREYLPFIEGLVEQPYTEVREDAAVAYVRIAGLDATPFVERVLSGESYGSNCKYLTAREFFAKIRDAENMKAQREKVDAAYEMLIRQAQAQPPMSTSWELDEMLCSALPEYSTSLQREFSLGLHLNATNLKTRAHFTKELDELIKTPPEKRTDLRTRFPGLGDALPSSPPALGVVTNETIGAETTATNNVLSGR